MPASKFLGIQGLLCRCELACLDHGQACDCVVLQMSKSASPRLDFADLFVCSEPTAAKYAK
jgi:hypothetical protein